MRNRTKTLLALLVFASILAAGGYMQNRLDQELQSRYTRQEDDLDIVEVRRARRSTHTLSPGGLFGPREYIRIHPAPTISEHKNRDRQR